MSDSDLSEHDDDGGLEFADTAPPPINLEDSGDADEQTGVQAGAPGVLNLMVHEGHLRLSFDGFAKHHLLVHDLTLETFALPAGHWTLTFDDDGFGVLQAPLWH